MKPRRRRLQRYRKKQSVPQLIPINWRMWRAMYRGRQIAKVTRTYDVLTNMWVYDVSPCVRLRVDGYNWYPYSIFSIKEKTRLHQTLARFAMYGQ